MTWFVFFVSGFAALLYQVVWQRSLFEIFGINIESVTVVVTAFMVGLGLGSLWGGQTSKNPKRPALLVFAAIEAGIGIFGLLSLTFFRVVGLATLQMPPVVTALVTFLLVLVPTMLMGSTLPVLVAHMVRRWTNVGSSVGALYFVNTLGSALASVLGVVVLLGTFGQTGTVRVAALCNFAASALAFRQHLKAS